jgi:arsenate reductase
MAEGWARHLLADQVDAVSAGTDPHGLNPLAVRAMAEAGVDISGHTSKTIDACDPDTLDLVVTVCGHANENCPVFLGNTRVIHHGFEDPPKLAADAKTEEEALPLYQRVRDEIRAFITTLPELLTQTKQGANP